MCIRNLYICLVSGGDNTAGPQLQCGALGSAAARGIEAERETAG